MGKPPIFYIVTILETPPGRDVHLTKFRAGRLYPEVKSAKHMGQIPPTLQNNTVERPNSA